MVVGIIDHSTGTRDQRKLARLRTEDARAQIAAWRRPAWRACRSPRFRRHEAAFGTVSDIGALPGWRPTARPVPLAGAAITMAYPRASLGRLRPQGPPWPQPGGHPSPPTRTRCSPSPAVLAVLGIVAALPPDGSARSSEPYRGNAARLRRTTEHPALWHGSDRRCCSRPSPSSAASVPSIICALRDHPVRPPDEHQRSLIVLAAS